MEIADPNICDSKGQTPPHAAAIRGTHSTAFDLDINTLGKAAMTFVQVGGAINESARVEQPLHIAARYWNGKPKYYLRMLLESGRIEPNQRDIKGRTALWIAASNGRVEVFNTLLECPSVDPNLGQKMLARLFANINLDPNRPNKDGQTALHAHIDGYAPDPECRTALHLAAGLHLDKEPARRVIRSINALLKDSRLDLTRLDNEKQMPNHAAVTADFAAAVKLLLDDGTVDLNAQDDMGDTALHRAVALGPRGSCSCCSATRG
ncbi:hypothetical protein DL769_002802 [Monosporascus sp. CRB-8-3]|nr:hypothetical protein DL769_002802 [Monosporascus sp. CRB-8-3]